MTSLISGAPLGRLFTGERRRRRRRRRRRHRHPGQPDRRSRAAEERTVRRVATSARRSFSLRRERSLESGTRSRTPIRGPGTEYVGCFASTRTFRSRTSEASRLQLRFEFYNFFNHTNFSAVDTAARFDAAGRQVNGTFGAVYFDPGCPAHRARREVVFLIEGRGAKAARERRTMRQFSSDIEWS